MHGLDLKGTASKMALFRNNKELQFGTYSQMANPESREAKERTALLQTWAGGGGAVVRVFSFKGKEIK